MSTSRFPGQVDSFILGGPDDRLNDPGALHVTAHEKLNDAMVATQTYVKNLTPSNIGAIPEPQNDGTSGQALVTDGSGGRSWQTVSGGGGGGGLPPMQGGPISGWWLTQPVGDVRGETPYLNGRSVVAPFPIHHQVTIDALDATIKSSTAGATLALHIYDSTQGGLPGDRLWSSAMLDASTAGQLIAEIDTPLTLEPGLYWVGFYSGSTRPEILAGSAGMWGNFSVPLYTDAISYEGTANNRTRAGYSMESHASVWEDPPTATWRAPVVRVRAV